MLIERTKEVESVIPSNQPRAERQTKRRTVVLTITENCNLECVYCFEKHKSNRLMTIDTAKRIVAEEFGNSGEYDEVEVDLFGGEPTLRKEFIQDLVAWMLGQEWPKPYIVFLETNGTLVHSEFQEWLVRNKHHVWAGLSLDGTRETHNATRSRSYDRIDVGFFVRTYPLQSVRMTVHPRTVGSLCQDVVHLHQLGFQDIVATFALGVDWSAPETQRMVEESLHALCGFYLSNPDIKECSLLSMHLPNILARDRTVQKWCGTGTHMVSYDVDGKRYPCHTFQQFTIANAASEWEEQTRQTRFGTMTDFTDPECGTCPIQGICPNCYGMNFVTNGNVLTRDKRLCGIVKIQAVANSYLVGEKLKRGITKMDAPKIYRMVSAIEVIQDQLLGPRKEGPSCEAELQTLG